MWDKLKEIEQRYHQTEAEMARPEVAANFDRLQALAREHASLEGIVTLLNEYRRLQDSLAQARSIIFSVGTSATSDLVVRNTETGESMTLTPGDYPVYSKSGHILYQTVSSNDRFMR